jgi:DNA ligase-1
MAQVSELKKCFEVFSQIEKTSSRNEKLSLLEQNESELLKQILYYTFNKALVYNIGERMVGHYEQKPVALRSGRALFKVGSDAGELFELLDKLSSNELTGNNAMTAVRAFINQDDELFFEWSRRIFLKDLKMGMSSKTINQVFKDLIPVFNVMKAELWSGESINRPFWLQRKMNGYRMVAFHYPDGVVIKSSNGVQIPGFDFIKQQVAQCLPVGCVFDGELADKNDKFSKIQELAFSEQSIDKTSANYFIWDTMSISEWEEKRTQLGYFLRYRLLQGYLYESKASNLVLLDNVFEYNFEEDIDPDLEIATCFEMALSKKWEGLMVKFDVPYNWDRSSDMLKIKKMTETDLVVTGVFEGKGNLKGKLGGVYVDYKGFKVGVGSGFKTFEKDAKTGERIDGHRIRFWDNPNLIIDKVIRVQYYEEMKDKNGNLSLQFPVFKGIHPEKNDVLF